MNSSATLALQRESKFHDVGFVPVMRKPMVGLSTSGGHFSTCIDCEVTWLVNETRTP
jgi:hypothetical protein